MNSAFDNKQSQCLAISSNVTIATINCLINYKNEQVSNMLQKISDEKKYLYDIKASGEVTVFPSGYAVMIMKKTLTIKRFFSCNKVYSIINGNEIVIPDYGIYLYYNREGNPLYFISNSPFGFHNIDHICHPAGKIFTKICIGNLMPDYKSEYDIADSANRLYDCLGSANLGSMIGVKIPEGSAFCEYVRGEVINDIDKMLTNPELTKESLSL